jgi:hypothetical protein
MSCIFENRDRPIFVLEADDKFFVPLVRMWAELVEREASVPIPDALCATVMEAMEIANRALLWQQDHPEQVTGGGARFPGGTNCRAIVAGGRQRLDAVGGS